MITKIPPIIITSHPNPASPLKSLKTNSPANANGAPGIAGNTVPIIPTNINIAAIILMIKSSIFIIYLSLS